MVCYYRLDFGTGYVLKMKKKKQKKPTLQARMQDFMIELAHIL
jgi:hypothetical protein